MPTTRTFQCTSNSQEPIRRWKETTDQVGTVFLTLPAPMFAQYGGCVASLNGNEHARANEYEEPGEWEWLYYDESPSVYELDAMAYTVGDVLTCVGIES